MLNRFYSNSIYHSLAKASAHDPIFLLLKGIIKKEENCYKLIDVNLTLFTL